MPKKPKHIPLRRCVVCRESKPQAELLRFVRADDGWLFDQSFATNRRKTDGRGAWLCKEKKCHKEKALKRFFRQDAVQVLASVNEFLETLALEPAKEQETVAVSHVKSNAADAKPKRIRVAPNGGMNV